MMDIFSTAEAAAYLGISVSTLKHHIYTRKALKPDRKVGRESLFTRATLDEFNARKPKVGRPRQYQA